MKRARETRHEDGQAIAEFALVFPILLVLTFGIIQFSLIYVAQGVIEYAAYAAARAELVNEDPQRAAAFVCSAIAGPSYDAGSGEAIIVPGWGELPRSKSSSSKTTVEVIDGIGNGSGAVTVEVTHMYELVIPFFSLLLEPLSDPAEPGDEPGDGPGGILRTIAGAPHIVLRSTYTRPVPWDEDMRAVTGHPVIPDL